MAGSMLMAGSGVGTVVKTCLRPRIGIAIGYTRRVLTSAKHHFLYMIRYCLSKCGRLESLYNRLHNVSRFWVQISGQYKKA
jgi:hypothetical protein